MGFPFHRIHLTLIKLFYMFIRHTEVWLNIGHQTQKEVPTCHIPHWSVLEVEDLELQTPGRRGDLFRTLSSRIQLPCLLRSAEVLQGASRMDPGRSGPYALMSIFFSAFPPSPSVSRVTGAPAVSSGVAVGGRVACPEQPAFYFSGTSSLIFSLGKPRHRRTGKDFHGVTTPAEPEAALFCRPR